MHIFFIHPFGDKYLDCFLLLAIVNNRWVNTEMQISLWDSDFSSFGCIPEVEYLGINLTKGVKNVYTENYITMMKDI